MNLPKTHFRKAKENLKKEYSFTKWSLFWKGKNFLKEDTFFSHLWLRNVPNEEYPINYSYGNFGTILKVKSLSASSSKFVLGSIFNNEGKLLNIPKDDSLGLNNINVILNNNNFKDSGIFNIFSKAKYPIPPIFGELKSAYYYKKTQNINGNLIDIIIPLQLINDFFFFSHSTKLNNHIISNIISENVKYIGNEMIDGKKIGMISQNRLEIKKQQALYYGRYFFTNNNSGLSALNELRTNHLIKIKNGENRVYFKSKIPFSFDINFKVAGQFISNNIFLGYRIIGAEPLENQSFFNTDKIIVSVLNDTRTANKYEDNSTTYTKDKVLNSYQSIETNNDNDYSDQSSETYDIIEEEKKDYSFYTIPENEVQPKDSNKNKYLLGKIIKGKDYSGGTSNMFGHTKESGITKTDTELTLYNLIDWNKFIIKTLGEICNEKGYKGYFIKLNSGNTEISYENYDDKINYSVLSISPPGTNKLFKFLLFRIIDEGRNFYYFDKGTGSYSAFFSDINFAKIEHNRLNFFIKKMITDQNLRWSPVSKEETFKPYGFVVYQPIEHITNKLKERLLKRILLALKL
ncbi:hypothetical protein MHM83_04290 [Tenacibaculum sp. Mcav3-52]|uniref:hypothetical protein n=1 Tax=Tenacibaculum sp. Mcav3-52 TaxID=2917762 RepID=UPI001EF186CA|nr:hypothetical protein [Tenacibaculum sp. Mcav3-52]MCG7501081.1 hypothetical protein [Tenacibaculum sp. Mcav3-52]